MPTHGRIIPLSFLRFTTFVNLWFINTLTQAVNVIFLCFDLANLLKKAMEKK